MKSSFTLLLGMMILVRYLRFARFLRYVTYLRLSRLHTGTQLLTGVIPFSGVFSAIFVNDTICLMMTPLVVQLGEETKLDLKPFLIVMELSRDHAHLPLWTFFKIGAPLTLLSTAMGVVILGVYTVLGI